MKPEPLGFHYVAVDGPIGVGKTTLVELLARRYEGVKILEDVDNPFLPDFYQDRPGAAFQTELYFLLSRYKQQQDVVAQRGLFERLLVADYTFQKNRVFAYLNLSDDELAIFDRLYTSLEPQIPPPELRKTRRYRAMDQIGERMTDASSANVNALHEQRDRLAATQLTTACSRPATPRTPRSRPPSSRSGTSSPRTRWRRATQCRGPRATAASPPRPTRVRRDPAAPSPPAAR